MKHPVQSNFILQDIHISRPTVLQPSPFGAQRAANIFFPSPQTNVSRAKCNKIIMLFTDGGEEKAEEIFKDSNLDKAVGSHTDSRGRTAHSLLASSTCLWLVLPLPLPLPLPTDRCASSPSPWASTTTTKGPSSPWPATTKVKVFFSPIGQNLRFFPPPFYLQ